ncbi:SemiSWEET transporter [Photobacterium sp. BZF1]|uniref:SemiSWEET transporter n=1 Tax=Photobacterium sp. BZF1 TaxID=1904457 RepID=UPI00165359E5|nr:SemiSWEET transporter [Photobacterium sp. BZF1]MBC7002399.1 SemiSWEET transporter [Photobacterium sp. BZF1]
MDTKTLTVSIICGSVLATLSLWVADYSLAALGSLAACCTTLAYLPQVIKIIRSKDTQSISLHMYALMVFGVFCWFIYGMKVNDTPVMLANAITLLLSMVILIMKLSERPQ